MEPEKKRKRPLGARILLAAGSLILFLLAVEVFFRVKYFSPMINPHPCSPGVSYAQYVVMPDSVAGYALRPYFEGEEVNRSGDFRVPVTVNAWGLRDRGLAPQLCEDCYRILMLGDSFTYGEGLRWEETYPVRVEEILNQRGGVKVQVINGGVHAYSLRRQSLRLKNYFPRLRPNLVTVCWVPYTFPREQDDMVYLNGYLVQSEEKDRVRVVGNNLFFTNYPSGSFRARGDLWLQAHSVAYFLTRFNLNGYLINLPFRRFFSRSEEQAPNVPPVYFLEPAKAILDMADFCRQNNARFLLILLQPSPANARQLSQYFQERNIPVLSLAENGYLLSSPYQKYKFRHDGHFNAEGDAYLAENLAPFLSRMLAPPSPAPP